MNANTNNTTIRSFRGENGFLSNMFDCPVTVGGITYRSSESAFQAQKSMDLAVRQRFAALTGAKAKQAGKTVALRADWETAKVGLMRDVLVAKFSQNPELAERLLATGDAELIEGNTWGDTFWGVDSKKGGRNELGKLLMELRANLRSERNRPEMKPINGKSDREIREAVEREQAKKATGKLAYDEHKNMHECKPEDHFDSDARDQVLTEQDFFGDYDVAYLDAYIQDCPAAQSLKTGVMKAKLLKATPAEELDPRRNCKYFILKWRLLDLDGKEESSKVYLDQTLESWNIACDRRTFNAAWKICKESGRVTPNIIDRLKALGRMPEVTVNYDCYKKSTKPSVSIWLPSDFKRDYTPNTNRIPNQK